MVDNLLFPLMETQNPRKIIIKIKKQKLQDQYVLTNKHIVCKFKYLAVCLNHIEDSEDNTSQSELTRQLVVLPMEQLKELIQEQNINLMATSHVCPFGSLLEHLREWHPRIVKVECDCQSMYHVDTLDEYVSPGIQSYLHDIQCCQDTEESFRIFCQQSYNVVDVNVYFELWRKISQISDYGVNFAYLRKLIGDQLIPWNLQFAPYLDEVRVSSKQLPFLPSSPSSEEPYYVYPSMYFVPLYR